MALLAAILAADRHGAVALSPGGEVLLANDAGALSVSAARAFGASSGWAPARDRARQEGRCRIDTDTGLAGELCRIAPEDSGIEVYLLRPDDDTGEDGLSRADRIIHLAHDLRAPLHSLILAAPPDPAGEDGIGVLAQLALNQIQNLLETMRMDEASLQTGPVEIFEIAGLVRDMALLLEPICRNSGNHIVTDLPEGASWHSGAAHLIRAILQNLITNANRFTPRGPVTVRLRLGPAQDRERLVTIEVEDTGPGLSEAERALLLSPSRKARQTLLQGSGYGLGLGIVTRAVRRLSGRIEIEGGKESGSLFRVSFPLATVSGPEASAPPARPVSLAGLRVLVVEDNPVNLSILMQSLTDAGAEVEGTGTGGDALKRIGAGKGRFDLVLLDVTLPDIDGIEVTRRIRQAEAEEEAILIVGLTAHIGAAVRGAALAAGMNHILSKPIRPGELHSALRDAWDGTLAARAALPERKPTMLLDDRLVQEITAEMGRDMALSFMRRALEEARGVLRAYRDSTDTETLRGTIHSAIGSAGMTGLAGVDTGLRGLQDHARRGEKNETAAGALERILNDTGARLDRFAQPE